ncbi:MAG: membrane protein of unknown function [Promethearchaeota archaeon]|nr:MAG: membrane protein of unknown function [Candidatus Lokiarchaeota archaeon]
MAESESGSTPEKEESTQPEPKKEKKPKKEGKSFDQELRDRFGKWGYTTIFDIIVFIAGIYGLVWFLIDFIADLIGIITIGVVLYWIITIIVLIMIIFFPFMSKLFVKMNNKWSKMPLSFIDTQQKMAEFILFIDWWSVLIFWWVGTVFLLHAFWYWGIVWILLTIALFREVFQRKS